MKHPSNKRERIKLKRLKDEPKKVLTTKNNKVWKHGLDTLKEWEANHELQKYKSGELSDEPRQLHRLGLIPHVGDS